MVLRRNLSGVYGAALSPARYNETHGGEPDYSEEANLARALAMRWDLIHGYPLERNRETSNGQIVSHVCPPHPPCIIERAYGRLT